MSFRTSREMASVACRFPQGPPRWLPANPGGGQPVLSGAEDRKGCRPREPCFVGGMNELLDALTLNSCLRQP